LGNSYAEGCGAWNLGDGNVYDEDNELMMRLEALPPAPKEEVKEPGVDPKRNVFGEKGERLKALPTGSTVVINDEDDELSEVILPPLSKLRS
jgi:hypothetical protein